MANIPYISATHDDSNRNIINTVIDTVNSVDRTATNTKESLDNFLNGTGVVTNRMLANDAINRSKIPYGLIDELRIADKSVGNSKLKTGGVHQENIADRAVGTDQIGTAAVTNEKLAEVPFKRNIIASNTSLSTVAENGRYIGLAGNSYSDLPSTMINKSFVLDVQTFNDNQNFIIQTITETRTPSHSYIRYIQKGTFVGEWEKDLSLTPQIERRVIPENATTRFMTSNGQFLGISGYNYADIPDEVNNRSFMLEVKTFNDNELFVVQTLTVTSNIDVTYKRYIRDGGASPFVSEWYKDYSLIKPSEPSIPTGHPLDGKNIVCFGDSLTEFGDYTGKIQAATGANVTNVGFGGCRMAKSPEGSNRYDYNEMSMVALSETVKTGDFTALDAAAINLKDNHNDDNTAAVERLKNTDFSTVDYITIFYGTNDHNGEIPLGANDSADEFEFNGAINLTIENILTAYPHIRILFLTPTWRGRRNVGDGQESDNNPNPSGVYLIEFVEAIEERANSHKLPSYNLYNNSGINQYTSAHYQTDGLHLTDKGDEVISRRIAHELSGM